MRSYHCDKKNKSFFEGWYFKHQNGEKTIAFIPGVQADDKGKRSAFIQVITDDSTCNAIYPFNAFEADRNELNIRIGKNEFSEKGVKIDLEAENFSCKGDIVYGSLERLDHKVMGPFRFIPFMECNHEVISTKHGVAGELRINHKGGENSNIVFGKGSTGYIETDWGRSFPNSYAWIQCNRFDDEECFVMASAAVIPFLGTSFTGCTCAVNFRGESHTLATYSGARVNYFNKYGLDITQGKKRLQVEVIKENGQTLLAPKGGRMCRSIRESPSCKVRFRFSSKDNVYFDTVSSHASFEYTPLS